MTVTSMSGPIVISPPIGDQDQGPSPIWGNTILLDPRVGYAGGGLAGSPAIAGWGGSDYLTVKQIPSTLSATNIAPGTAVATGGVPMTLVSTSAAGITVGVTVGTRTGCLAIDLNPTGLSAITNAAAAVISYGSTGAVTCYDPRRAISRAVQVVSAGADTAVLTVRGFDLYGQPMSEGITLNGATPVIGRKAFKYIVSVTSSATTANNISVGTADVYGLPLLLPQTPAIVATNAPTAGGPGGCTLIQIFWAGAQIAASANALTGLLCGDNVNTPALSGNNGGNDVRGTYASASASNNTRELVISQFVPPWLLSPTAGLTASTAYAGLFGLPQFTN